MQKFHKNIDDYRQADHPIDDIFITRWSPRAFSGELLSEEQFNSLLEAARWAPSSFNEQPWRFIWAKRDTLHWQTFCDLLLPGNQAWAEAASHLIVVCSKKTFTYNGKDNGTYSFDTGAAWANLANQAASMDIVTHGMAGFDYDKAADVVQAGDDFQVEAMIAVGLPGDPATLGEDLQKAEEPSGRNAITDFAPEGSLGA